MAGAPLFATLSLIAGLAAGTASAGDFATFVPIGFSDDGKVFAFEEYGVQDGSGFPYSNIFFIDTENDSFLDGTPYRVRLDDEAATVGGARAAAVGEAIGLIQQYSLLDHPGWLAAFNPVTEEDTGDTLDYRSHPNLSPVYQLSLEDFPLPARSACAAVTEDGRGYRLTFTPPEGENRVLHADDRIPASRGCPLGYRLGGVMTYLDAGSPVHVALVNVLTQGFEGPDGRWLALPFKP